jgi:Na+/H+ antiporter NhaD/arsenite permease-like protein
MGGILLSVALGPLVARRIWHRHYGTIGAAWALAFVVPGCFVLGWAFTAEHVLHVLLLEYVPFLILIGSLFVVSGGVMLSGPFQGTPRSNAGLLLAGTAFASAIGTTGASMLFIRPLLRANRGRRYRTHTIVFFIFLVSNVGGSLTPLGDPPLFLGFLQGVPFFWTTTHLIGPTMFLTGTVLTAFLVIDTVLSRRERKLGVAPPERPPGPVAISVEGGSNLVLLLLVGAVVLGYGVFSKDRLFLDAAGRPLAVDVGPVHVEALAIARDAALVLIALVSLGRTPRHVRQKNEFLWEPLREVAILFAAIFTTMAPVLLMLQAGEAGAFKPLIERVRGPEGYFWLTGALSSFLDNAPTYLVFFELAHATPMAEFATRGAWGAVDPVHPVLVDMPSRILLAISAGAVFMGAMTYIGNGPNFMVRTIAAQAGVPMPSFFGYVLKWSVPILLPLIAVMAWLFVAP